jgi:hypothetical protein
MITPREEIKAKDVKTLLLRVYTRYQGGAITASQAHKETYLLNSVLRAIEATDLETRLEKIESALNYD